MQHRSPTLFFVLAGLVVVFGSGLWLATARPVKAQCGSQASSCKNCHEVQAQKPVNADGTGWHQSHAFGDFCYICHAGNQQATEKDAAHAGMVPPLADVKASCQQCHPKDLDARAKVYADALGIPLAAPDVPTAAVPTAAPVVEAAAVPAAATQGACVPAVVQADVNDPNLVDYAKIYDQIVLGKKPVNWVNVFLLTLIGLVLAGGAGLVIVNKRLIKITFGDTKQVEGEHPADVVDMLPAIARLDSKARKSLKNVLASPKKAEKVLALIDAVVSDEKEKQP